MTLDKCEEGKYKIVNLGLGKRFRERCMSYGITIGEEIVLESNNGWGPLVVNVRGSKYGIGRNFSNKIEVDKI